MRATIATAAVSVLLAVPLTGCASDGASEAAPATESHTMPDGSVMEGETHVHSDDHDHGSAAGDPQGPSAAARMVCAGDVVDDVRRIMDVADEPEPESEWVAPTLTCTFDLDEGPLVVSVHDADDRDDGMAYFEGLRAGAEGASAIAGVSSLGLPAFRTGSGRVAFIRDGKTLEVDARGLRGRRFGAEDDQSRADVAYAVANSVLACWTEHD
jgi:hypothetical protein